MTINNIYNFINNQITNIGDSIKNSAPYQFAAEKAQQFSYTVENLDEKWDLPLHLIPLVNIIIHFTKEHAFRNRPGFDNYNKFRRAEIKITKLETEIDKYNNVIENLETQLQAIRDRRAELDQNPLPEDAGFKDRLARNFNDWQNSPQKIQALQTQLDRYSQKQNNIQTEIDLAQIERDAYQNAAQAPHVVATLEQRAKLRTHYRYGLIALAVAAVAISIFFPLAIVPLFLLLGVSIGTHLANVKYNHWIQAGEEFFDDAEPPQAANPPLPQADADQLDDPERPQAANPPLPQADADQLDDPEPPQAAIPPPLPNQ